MKPSSIARSGSITGASHLPLTLRLSAGRCSRLPAFLNRPGGRRSYSTIPTLRCGRPFGTPPTRLALPSTRRLRSTDNSRVIRVTKGAQAPRTSLISTLCSISKRQAARPCRNLDARRLFKSISPKLIARIVKDREIAQHGLQGVHAEVMRQMASQGSSTFVDYAEVRTIWERLVTREEGTVAAE